MCILITVYILYGGLILLYNEFRECLKRAHLNPLIKTTLDHGHTPPIISSVHSHLSRISLFQQKKWHLLDGHQISNALIPSALGIYYITNKSFFLK